MASLLTVVAALSNAEKLAASVNAANCNVFIKDPLSRIDWVARFHAATPSYFLFLYSYGC